MALGPSSFEEGPIMIVTIFGALRGIGLKGEQFYGQFFGWVRRSSSTESTTIQAGP